MNQEEMLAMAELEKTTDFQRILSNSILDIFNQFLRSVLLAIWINGDLDTRNMGCQFAKNGNKYEVMLSITKKRLVEDIDD